MDLGWIRDQLWIYMQHFLPSNLSTDLQIDESRSIL